MTASTSQDLDPVWLRAAMLGSMWASTEIIVGSFLHNMKFPFTGTLLAAIGTALVVAGSGIWPDKGLIWRSGLVCALMKSVSPSAVILGPMIGIMTEAALLEGAVRIIGRNPFGYAAGGMLAVAAPLVQNLTSLVVLYGWDMARLYVGAFEAGARFLGVTSLGPVDALLFVLGLHALVGFAAAITGHVAGRRAAAVPEGSVTFEDPGALSVPEPIERPRYSLLLLLGNLVVTCAVLATLSSVPLWVACLGTLAYVAAIWLLYPVARRRLSSWRLWGEIVVVAVLAGVILGDLPHGGAAMTFGGAAAGLQMALRAGMLVAAFRAISVELRNPVVVEWFLRRGMGKLASAVEVAFEALPFMTGAIGQQRRFLREPLRSIVRLIAAGRDWLAGSVTLPPHRVYVLSGDRGSGKTRLLTAIAETLVISGRRVGGILSPVVIQESSRLGYDVLDLQSGRQMSLCRRDIEATGGISGPFHFAIEAIDFGNAALDQAAAANVDLIILDEVGTLEFDGQGWAPGLERLLAVYHGPILLVVRPSLVGRLAERWPLTPVRIWNAGEVDRETLTRELLALLGRRRSRPSGR